MNLQKFAIIVDRSKKCSKFRCFFEVFETRRKNNMDCKKAFAYIFQKLEMIPCKTLITDHCHTCFIEVLNFIQESSEQMSNRYCMLIEACLSFQWVSQTVKFLGKPWDRPYVMNEFCIHNREDGVYWFFAINIWYSNLLLDLGDDPARFTCSYAWLCDILRNEQLYILRVP